MEGAGLAVWLGTALYGTSLEPGRVDEYEATAEDATPEGKIDIVMEDVATEDGTAEEGKALLLAEYALPVQNLLKKELPSFTPVKSELVDANVGMCNVVPFWNFNTVSVPPYTVDEENVPPDARLAMKAVGIVGNNAL